MKRFKFILLLLASVMLGSCTRISAEVEMHDLKPIVARTTSPDGSIEAVLTYKGYGGAAGSEAYLVYIHRTATPRGVLVLTGLYLKDVRFSWPSRNILDISMACGDVQSFQNFFYFFKGEGGQQRKITINLQSQGNCPPFS